MVLQEKTEVLGERPVQMPVRPPEFSHVLGRDCTCIFVVGGCFSQARPLLVFTYMWIVFRNSFRISHWTDPVPITVTLAVDFLCDTCIVYPHSILTLCNPCSGYIVVKWSNTNCSIFYGILKHVFGGRPSDYTHSLCTVHVNDLDTPKRQGRQVCSE